MRTVLSACVVAALLLPAVSVASPQHQGGAVATAQPAATHAALEVLRQGGNAVDAAVAAAATVGVVGPWNSGLGGGGFALVHDPKGGDYVLDFREVAPKAATRDMYLRDGKVDPGLSLDGALSVAVPGAAKGYLELHRKGGRLPLSKVLAPAIRAAKAGFVVTPAYLDRATERLDCLAKDPEAARIFLVKGKDGAPAVPPAGTLLKQPDLARTLETLAREGDAPFYGGRLARSIAATAQAQGGVLTLADLAAYRTRTRAPLEGTYRGHRVLTMPPPSSGGIIVLQALGVLERAGATGLVGKDPRVVHLFIEGLRRAFLDRLRFLGDPDFSDVPTARLVSREHLDALYASIDPRRASKSAALVAAAGAGPAADAGTRDRPHTTHLSVVDKDGGAVALTTTLNYSFGSCVVAKGTGVLLNDQMDDFAAAPNTPNAYGLVQGEANSIAPGKVPLSSMAPTLVFQKDAPTQVRLVVGSPGGSTIPTTVAQVISHVVDGRLDAATAVAQGRVHHQLLPDELRVDPTGLDASTVAALEALGHVVKRRDGTWGDPMAVAVDPVTQLRSAGANPEGEGLALGLDQGPR